ncbi:MULTISPECIES: hypothetical protein, partial [Halocynthiibacter]
RNPTSVDIQTLIHRMNQTAHISLQILIMSNSQEAKTDQVRRNSLAPAACIVSNFLCVALPCCFQCGPFGAPVSITASPVRGVLGLAVGVRKRFFQKYDVFLKFSRNTNENNSLQNMIFQIFDISLKLKLRITVKYRQRTAYPQTRPLIAYIIGLNQLGIGFASRGFWRNHEPT